MIKVIVYSEVCGYMWGYMENGVIMDEFGERPDLEGPLNDQLIQVQLEGRNG